MQEPDLLPDSLQKKELNKNEFKASMKRVKKRISELDSVRENQRDVERFSADNVELEELLVALARDGAVIVNGVLNEAQLHKVKSEMEPYVRERAYGPDDFFGKKTRRVGGLIARSPASWDICACPIVLQVCSAVLGHQVLHSESSAQVTAPGFKTHPWNLDLTQVIDIEPGESHQVLHRDRWAYIYDFEAIEPRISTMWAIDEFTAENGATRVIPGSHTWPRGRLPTRDDIHAQAVMAPGSVMIYTGSTWHSGGQNKTSSSRYGINVDYSVAWLKQEENQFLTCPPHLAKDLPQEIQELIGYSRSGYALGYVAGGFPPSYSWSAPKAINWAQSKPDDIRKAASCWKPKYFSKL